MSTQGTLIQLTQADLAWPGALAPETSNAERDARIAALLSSDGPHTYALEGALPGVHYLLAGDGTGPLAFLMDVTSGEPVDISLPLTQAHLLSPSTVAAIADAIESMSARAIRVRLESAALRSCEPFSPRPLEDEDKEWLLAVLQGLMTFMRRTADDRVALLVARH